MREADGPTGKVAVKIILKKNVKGNEQMVYDELEMLQRMKHRHIVKFVDWFESRVRIHRVALEWTLLTVDRTNIISSHNWPREENCSIVSASREGLQKRTHHKPFDRCLKLSITYTITTWFTGVSESRMYDRNSTNVCRRS